VFFFLFCVFLSFSFQKSRWDEYKFEAEFDGVPMTKEEYEIRKSKRDELLEPPKAKKGGKKAK